MALHRFLFVLCLSFISSLKAQEMLYSLNSSSPIILNPASAGTAIAGRGYYNRGLLDFQSSNAEISANLTFDGPALKLGGGVGLILQNHIIGNGLIYVSSIKGIYNYFLPVNKKFTIRIAVQPGYESKYLNNDILSSTPNPIQTFSYLHPVFFDSSFTHSNKKTDINYFTLGSGLLINFRKIEFGCSFQNINRPDWAFTSGVISRKPVQSNFHLQIPIKNFEKFELNFKSLFSHQVSSSIICVGTQLKSKQWMSGLTYNHYLWYIKNLNYIMGSIGYTNHIVQIRCNMEFSLDKFKDVNPFNISLSLIAIVNSKHMDFCTKPFPGKRFVENTF